MIFNLGLKSTVRKKLIASFCIAVIVTIWYFENSRRIPQYGEVFYEMGVNCEDKCRPEKQLRYFQKAIYYNPYQKDTHYRSALIYEKEGNYDKAFEFFINATEKDYWNNMAYYKAGLYYFREGAYEYARRYFLQAVKSRIGIPDVSNYYLAQVFDQLKEYDRAIEYYTNVALLNSEYGPQIYPRLAEIYYFIKGEDVFTYTVLKLRAATEKEKYLADQMEYYFKAIKVSESGSKG